MKPDHLDPKEPMNSKQCYEAWRHAFDINEPIYVELCHEFYSTYEFNELVQDDKLWSKVGEEGFKTYFRGGLRSDEHFSAREHWLSISRDEDLHLSRSHASTIRKPILRVLQKMISYRLCQRTNRHDKVQKNDMWLLMDEKERSWESEREHDLLRSVYYAYGAKDELIIRRGSNAGAPRVAMPVPPHPSMQDLYDGLGNMEIRQGLVERMAFRQSYQWDRYGGVFEHMAGVYDIPLQGAYNPPGYDQQHYQQYYQQQQQGDDDE
ncbi:hypothetical protein Tco_1362145 [Tanacetum coccineum]